ncbi:MAG: hypothetical protein LBF60_07360, partial [Treponema sp.]|nr:hypothetical protein [Treponema sp.]
MKHTLIFAGMAGLLLAFGLIICGCPNFANGESDQERPAPVDPAFWFGETHTALIDRIGEVRVDEDGAFLDDVDTEEVDMEEIANCQYVCDAINAKWGTDYEPASETAALAANCEYLLKTLDNANSGATSYGASGYATKQAVDKTAVDDAVQRLWKPAGKFVAVAAAASTATAGSIVLSASSSTGVNWRAASLPRSADWDGVAYGDGNFVAVATSSDRGAYS